MLKCIMLTRRILFSYFYMHYEIFHFCIKWTGGKVKWYLDNWHTQRIGRHQFWFLKRKSEVREKFLNFSSYNLVFQIQQYISKMKISYTVTVVLWLQIESSICIALQKCHFIFSAKFLLKSVVLYSW